MNPQWTIKPFEALTLHELHDLLRLREAVFVVEQACAYQEIDGQDPQALHVLARSPEGMLLAYARILPPGADGLPHIGRVVVHTSARKVGLARKLMRVALDAVQERYGSRRSGLAAQAHLEGFYASLGYQRQGPDYPWDGIPHVDMVRGD